MPIRKKPTKKSRRKQIKQSVDKKQNKRIKSLEKFVYKTIENKQVDQYVVPYALSTAGASWGDFLTLSAGPNDGTVTGSAARIGNSITLMKQTFNFGLQASNTDSYNRVRLIVVEGLENQNIALSDILVYDAYSLYGDLVFSSPYTTKTATSKRYKIYMDKVMELNEDARGATRDFKFIIKYREGGSPGKVLNFPSNSASVPTNHNMRILAISDSVSSTHPTLTWNVRSMYKDA